MLTELKCLWKEFCFIIAILSFQPCTCLAFFISSNQSEGERGRRQELGALSVSLRMTGCCGVASEVRLPCLLWESWRSTDLIG